MPRKYDKKVIETQIKKHAKNMIASSKSFKKSNAMSGIGKVVAKASAPSARMRKK